MPTSVYARVEGLDDLGAALFLQRDLHAGKAFENDASRRRGTGPGPRCWPARAPCPWRRWRSRQVGAHAVRLLQDQPRMHDQRGSRRRELAPRVVRRAASRRAGFRAGLRDGSLRSAMCEAAAALVMLFRRRWRRRAQVWRSRGESGIRTGRPGPIVGWDRRLAKSSPPLGAPGDSPGASGTIRASGRRRRAGDELVGRLGEEIDEIVFRHQVVQELRRLLEARATPPESASRAFASSSGSAPGRVPR